MGKIFALLFIFLCTKAIGQGNLPPPYEIKTDTILTQYLDNSYWQMLEDKDGKGSIGQVSNLPVSDKFHKHDTLLRETDIDVNTYWFR